MPVSSTKPAFHNKPVGGSTSPAFESDGNDGIFARFAQLVRTSKELHGCTVRAWDDPTVDHSPPGADGPPWVRLTPSPGEAEFYCSDPAAGGLAHRMPMTVAIETSTPGTDVIQSQRFWGAILRAIFPGKILDAQLQHLGVASIRVVKPSWGAPGAKSEKDPVAGERCEAAGAIEMIVYFVTPEY